MSFSSVVRPNVPRIGHHLAMASSVPASKNPDRQPRRAEVVADNLRDRILRGEFEDGSDLPKQEELFDDFGVSMPSIREAMRILETEGLITVRRGNRGGAVVHRPQSRTAAYMFGLRAAVGGVPVADLALAMRHLDPLCAAMCAGRSATAAGRCFRGCAACTRRRWRASTTSPCSWTR